MGRSFLTAPVALAELMRFLSPSTLLVRCLAWSSRLAVCSWVRVSRSGVREMRICNKLSERKEELLLQKQIRQSTCKVKNNLPTLIGWKIRVEIEMLLIIITRGITRF